MALIIVLLTGVYLLVLAAASLMKPELARRFLGSFASSASAHYLELFVRLVVGGAFVLAAPQMRFPVAFSGFGWIVIGTTIGLLVLPWRWHHRFAQWSVPMATRNMALFAIGPILAGVAVLLAVVLGSDAGGSAP